MKFSITKLGFIYILLTIAILLVTGRLIIGHYKQSNKGD
jgi:hypothetical protein